MPGIGCLLYLSWMRTGCEAHLGTFHPIGPLLLWFIFFLGLIQIIPPMLFVYFWEKYEKYILYFFYPICSRYPGLPSFIYSFNCSSSIKWAPTQSSNITKVGWTLLVKYGQCVYEVIVEYVSKYIVEVILKMNSQIASCLPFFLCFFAFFQYSCSNDLH